MPTARAGARRLMLSAVLIASTAAILVVPSSDAVDAIAAPKSPISPPAADAEEDAANIIYVVIDDMSSNLVQYMANVGTLADRGVTFDNYVVTDSQCCPSRASTLTGQYPHNNDVTTNTWPDGGYDGFARHNLDSSMGAKLSAAGYRTGFIGKFLNGYEPEGTVKRRRNDAPAYPRGFVPPGWNEWHVAGSGYANFDYTLAEAVDVPVAELNTYGHDPEDYMTDVLSEKSTDFLDRAATIDAPFFLTVSPFATHSRVGAKGDLRFPPAPRDRELPDDGQVPNNWPMPDFADGDCGLIEGGCSAVPFPDPADAATFGLVPKQAHSWMRDKKLRPRQIEELNRDYLDRIRMAQSVDDLVGALQADLDRLSLSDSTYIVFTSDNGYHLGEHGMMRGKNSAFDTDIKVPLIVVPPGGTTPAHVPAIVQNTDFLPTFLDIAGDPAPELNIDGRSMLPMIQAPDVQVPDWRKSALIQYAISEGEDEGGSPGKLDRSDPDRDSTGEPPPYFALRAEGYVYVNYSSKKGTPKDKDAEFYDYVNDPGPTVNRYRELSNAQKNQLARAVARYEKCAGVSCTSAGLNVPRIVLPPLDGAPGRRGEQRGR